MKRQERWMKTKFGIIAKLRDDPSWEKKVEISNAILFFNGEHDCEILIKCNYLTINEYMYFKYSQFQNADHFFLCLIEYFAAKKAGIAYDWPGCGFNEIDYPADF